MLEYIHYGSTNETYKIAYGQQALTSRHREHQLYQVRKLPSFETTPHCVLGLRILPRQESFRFSEKSRKETEKIEGQEGGGEQIGMATPALIFDSGLWFIKFNKSF
jgi:hypothetical protein